VSRATNNCPSSIQEVKLSNLNSVRRWSKAAISAAAVSWFASQASAVPVLVDEEKGINFQVGALIQPQLQISKPMADGEGAFGPPDGKSPNFEFFLRRARILAFGSVTKELSFFIDTDSPNFGKAGNYTTSMFVQDAFISYAFVPEFKIDMGMMLLPLSHHSIEGAGAQNMLDYHSSVIRFPGSKVFRDTGVQFRGVLLNDKLAYRLGIFEGVRNTPPAAPPVMGAPAPVVLNEAGLPRITGQVRFNALGAENDFFLKGIYFSPTPIISIGVGADVQSKAVVVVDEAKTYSAISADVFAEYPFSADDELIFKANFVKYGKGTAQLPNGANALFAEVGFRHGIIEPVAFIDYVADAEDAYKYMSPHVGVNFWSNKYTFNTKVDIGFIKQDTKIAAVAPATGTTTVTTKDIQATVQTQLYF
jgi:hypothetical protein